MRSGASQQAERTIATRLLVSAILCVGVPSPSLCLRDDVSLLFASVFVGYDPLVSRFRGRLQGKGGKFSFKRNFANNLQNTICPPLRGDSRQNLFWTSELTPNKKMCSSYGVLGLAYEMSHLTQILLATLSKHK